MHRDYRQHYHLEPPEGWMNDPNGLCYYKGEYHVYFQYSPESATGETLRTWGHFHGKDLFHMTFDTIVLFPDHMDDRTGVFSGCALEEKDLLHIFYTGNVEEEGDYDYIHAGRGANVIHVTSTDGSTMSPKRTLLRNKDYPSFCSCHVRDPKVWKSAESACWYMVLGARTIKDEGCVLLYTSKDLTNWTYVRRLMLPDFGYMWECPDYFKLEKQGFLSISPQGLPKGETRFQNAHQSGYFRVIEDIERTNCAISSAMEISEQNSLESEISLGEFHEWDMGFDFYAPQTFEAPDGRRILIGWMGIGDSNYSNATIPLGWQHCLTIPRELTLSKDGRILQNPIKELGMPRRELPDGEFTLTFEGCLDLYKNFEDICKPNGNSEDEMISEINLMDAWFLCFDDNLHLRFDAENVLFTMEFTDREYGCNRTIRRIPLSICRNIRILVDASSMEVYLNNGEIVMSTRFYAGREEIVVSGNIPVSGKIL